MNTSHAIMSAAAAACAASAAFGVELDVSPDRVSTPLSVDMARIGTITPRSASEIEDSNWTLGCETLDRDFADFWQYCKFIAPLGIKTIRLQAGWAKCEKVPGTYDFEWLDKIVDYAVGQGLNVLLETSYGNPAYKGAGGWDLGAGFPTSEEGLAAWDRWVDAMARHFAGRVRDWAMWNEPDSRLGKEKTPEEIAAFNVRTAKIIKGVIPDARIGGLSLARNEPSLIKSCLEPMGEDVSLFDWLIYHCYTPCPEDSYANVEAEKKLLARYNPNAKMRQGENGCPSEMATKFALSGYAWSEYSQAKWDMRRMLGDLGHDIESSVFTICDFNHKGREINRKGLLRANEDHEVIAVKRAYYAVQNVASVFDSSLARVAKPAISTHDPTLALYEYRAKNGAPLFVFWTYAKAEGRDKFQTQRPGDSFETRPAVLNYDGTPLEDPVWVDLLTGRIYEFPENRVRVHSRGVTYIDVPVYDSPVILTERAVVMHGDESSKGKGNAMQLTWHKAGNPNGTAVLICPGGGYGGLCSSYEGHDIAAWLNRFGITGVVLDYRVAPHHYPCQLNDVTAAMREVRFRAAEYGIDPKRIGVAGFSAGGHLASTIATHWDEGDPEKAGTVEGVSCRPDFQILVYPVITLGEGTHDGTRDNFLGPYKTPAMIERFSNERQVDANTPPAFVAHSIKDEAVPAENSRKYVAALEAAGVLVKYHELAEGAHGLGCGNGPQWKEWQDACEVWLKETGLGNED